MTFRCWKLTGKYNCTYTYTSNLYLMFSMCRPIAATFGVFHLELKLGGYVIHISGDVVANRICKYH